MRPKKETQTTSSVRRKFAFGTVSKDSAKLCTSRDVKEKARAEWVAQQSATTQQRYPAPKTGVQETFVSTEAVHQTCPVGPGPSASGSSSSASSSGPVVPGPGPSSPGRCPAWPPRGPWPPSQNNSHGGQAHSGNEERKTAAGSPAKEQLFRTRPATATCQVNLTTAASCSAKGSVDGKTATRKTGVKRKL